MSIIFSKSINSKDFKIQLVNSQELRSDHDCLIFSTKTDAPGIFVLPTQHLLDLPVKGLAVNMLNCRKVDLYGWFTPKLDNSNQLDIGNNSKHTILFSNTLFRPTDNAKLEWLRSNNALSSHLKAELVELFDEQSMVPPHCHGKALKLKQFKQRFSQEFEIKSANENHPHPQMIYIVSGSGRLFVDEEVFEIAQGDLAIYGANTVHGSKANPGGLSFIHCGWEAQS